MEEEKRCSMCHEWKPLTEFKSGGYCIPCQSIYHKYWRTTLNKEGYNTYMRNYFRNNPHIRVINSLRARLCSLVHDCYVSETLNDNLGCPDEFFRSWLEFQFDDEMNWDNYGTYWHIDHVLPVSMFNHDNIEAVKKCWNWVNLRPLEAKENSKKSNSVDFRLYDDQEILADQFFETLQLPNSCLDK